LDLLLIPKTFPDGEADKVFVGETKIKELIESTSSTIVGIDSASSL